MCSSTKDCTAPDSTRDAASSSGMDAAPTPAPTAACTHSAQRAPFLSHKPQPRAAICAHGTGRRTRRCCAAPSVSSEHPSPFKTRPPSTNLNPPRESWFRSRPAACVAPPQTAAPPSPDCAHDRRQLLRRRALLPRRTRLPRQLRPKREGSSEVNISACSVRLGRKPCGRRSDCVGGVKVTRQRGAPHCAAL